MKIDVKIWTLCVAMLFSARAQAFSFEIGEIQGAFDSTIGVGLGKRVSSPDCNLVIAGATGKGAPNGCLSPSSGVTDQGDLNYKKGDFFTTYIKGNHELLLKAPDNWTFMARGTWIKDVAATHTSGINSALAISSVNDGLPDQARDDLSFFTRLLDFWVSKSFNVYDHRVRVRAGKQAVNWGESLFLYGGINATNPLDLQRLSTPGTQIKEGVLTTPMVSVTAGLGNGFDMEVYVKQGWTKSFFPPVGSYWSTTSSVGSGSSQYGVQSTNAKDSGQWGAALRWQPESVPLNLALYAMNYHDNIPQLTLDQTTFTQNWVYPEDRKLYGISANFPVGGVAFATELSYRPNDAISLSPATGCVARAGQCYVDRPRYQWDINAIFSMTPGNSGPVLDFFHASSGTLLMEFAATHYSGFKSSYDGMPVSAGYLNWGLETDPTANVVPKGSATSSAMVIDFSLIYDGTVIPGWQLVPGIYYSLGLSGRTPNVAATFTNDVKTMNLYLGINSLPPAWQITANYSRFMGGKEIMDNLLRDRDYVGFSVSRIF